MFPSARLLLFVPVLLIHMKQLMEQIVLTLILKKKEVFNSTCVFPMSRIRRILKNCEETLDETWPTKCLFCTAADLQYY